MAYYNSLGKLLDGGYRFTEVWSGDNAVNVAINGETNGFKIGDIVLFMACACNHTVNGNSYLSSSTLYFQGCKCVFSVSNSTTIFNSSATFLSSGNWISYNINGSVTNFVYMGQVLQNTITLVGSLPGSPKGKLYKISDTN